MCIVICIIYVHDDVNVFVYEYVDGYADGYVNDNDSYYCMCNVYRYLYMHELENEN